MLRRRASSVSCAANVPESMACPFARCLAVCLSFVRRYSCLLIDYCVTAGKVIWSVGHCHWARNTHTHTQRGPAGLVTVHVSTVWFLFGFKINNNETFAIPSPISLDAKSALNCVPPIDKAEQSSQIASSIG